MQLLNLELDHFNLYCPSTGEYILLEDEGVNEEALSLKGYWVDEVMGNHLLKMLIYKKLGMLL